MDDRRWRPVDLARATGISVSMVRTYEAVGFIPPADRTTGGHRRYTAAHLDALRTARILIAGYGWQSARAILRAVHQRNVDAALEIVNERHAELDRRRQRLDSVLSALQVVAAQPGEPVIGLRRPMRIGEAARRAGVRPSALRFWEQQNLLSPTREPDNGMRLYDERQLRNLAIVTMLRDAGHGFDMIRVVLTEINAGRPGRALDAVQHRRNDLAAASRARARATAALWAYVEQLDEEIAAINRT